MEGVALALKKASGADLVVVTVENLGGYTIEEYALELFRRWGLGDKEKNNGVLLLVNKENVLTGQSGRVRIEVGYGLEGAIPDGKAGRI
ncbi:MAG: TPM domain-containing protein, partial [Clostridia bacterium]|nr:TPM domain-containing protein [Clostridia bacterium]